MKKNYILSILVIAISFSNHAYSQLQYSLDSVELYLGDGNLENKRIITKKDQEGYWTNSDQYYYGAGTKEFIEKSEINYFPNYEIKESITYNCFPLNGRDTCLTNLHEVFNEEGDLISYFFRAVFAYVNRDQLIITGDFRSRDSTVLDSNGRLKTQYNYGYDFDNNSWGFNSQREYFYSQDGELDSIHRYRPDEATRLILTSKIHYERFPNELKELTTTYFSDGEVEYYETQNVIIDGIEKPSSAIEYKLNGADTIITYQSNTQYSNLYSERVYNFF